MKARKALESVPGVRTAKVDFDEKEAHISFDASKATIEKLTYALKKLGYTASVKSWPKA